MTDVRGLLQFVKALWTCLGRQVLINNHHSIYGGQITSKRMGLGVGSDEDYRGTPLPLDDLEVKIYDYSRLYLKRCSFA